MAMCIAAALTKAKNSELDLDTLEEYFGRWLKSPPFDIGITTKNALKGIDLKAINPLKTLRNVWKIN
jgi:hypothetical protein